MKNILILANGSISEYFIDWLGKNKVAQNEYHVVSYNNEKLQSNIDGSIEYINIDPTSFSKLYRVMSLTEYSSIFIVMDILDDVKYSLKNIGNIDEKLQVIVLNQWGNELYDAYKNDITFLNRDELMATHLYDHLPNVPLAAQNVGLGRGEIMEVNVPFGSTYAYRHIGSVLQRKWKIAAIYREGKQILPTSATMIKPNDSLLIVGNPQVLDGVYRLINKRVGLFPEPFGKNIYLLLDFRYDKESAIKYMQESIYLLDKLEDKKLFIRIIFPNDFKLIDELKSYASSRVIFSVAYGNSSQDKIIEYDINEYNIGLVMSSVPVLGDTSIKDNLYALKKPLYIFGDKQLYNVQKSIVLMSENEKMESISSTAFDFSDTLDLSLTMGDFNPDGDFRGRKKIIEYYETLAEIFNTNISVEQQVSNPIREIIEMEDILQIAPFEEYLTTSKVKKFFSSDVEDFILTTNKHPKLLVPFD